MWCASDLLEGVSPHLTYIHLQQMPSERDVPALSRAITILEVLLADGPRPESEIEDHLEDAGISTARLRRANGQLGIISRKIGFRERTN